MQYVDAVKPSSLLLFLFSLLSLPAAADQINIAVAANFIGPMEEIAKAFESRSGHEVVISSGSSGKLFAQVQHGAPFDLFFSADQGKPSALVAAGLAVPDSRFAYALGRLVLWSPADGLVDGPGVLRKGGFSKLAIANPRLAPYGQAAIETLENLGLLADLRSRFVQGENIAQTFQFVATGNAPLGFVAASQVIGRGGSYWSVPGELHEPIRQEAVLLRRAEGSQAAGEFLRFVRSEPSRVVIEAHGYQVPEALAE